MTTKILVLGVAIIMLLGLFAGCGNSIPYNAVMYSDAKAWMNEEYLEANMTWDVSIQGEQALGINLPSTRTHIITDKTGFGLAFARFSQEVDFSKKMMLVYFFTSSYPTSPYKLEKITLDGDTLHVEFKLNKSGSSSVPDAGMPKQTGIIVLMDKLDINTAVFKQK